MANPTKTGKHQGFTYIYLLIGVAVMGVFLLAASEVWTKTKEHQDRKQLDWIGQQYIQAIARYYNANTGLVHVYPHDVNDLLEDPRYLGVKRHLRTVYVNPCGGQLPRFIPAPDGGIVGVEFDDCPVTSNDVKRYMFLPTESK